MKKKLFGSTPAGENVYLYTIKNGFLTAEISDRGATLVSFVKDGIDIVGGFDTLDAYLKDDSHQGATIGRVANRIENARFTIDGIEYNLPKNDNENCLHGGCGFDFKLWTVSEHTDDSITLEYTSADNEEGFPAELKVKISYTLSNNDLIIDYLAVPNGKTPISLTNHSYFNLDGFCDDILNHKVKIYADTYTEVSDTLIPTGRHPNVEGTVFDFRDFHEIGERVGKDFIGYDHNFPIKPEVYENFGNKKLALAAVVLGKKLKLSAFTDQPGVQLYIGNFLGNGPDFKGGVKQIKHGALCLEAQTEPNSVNHGVGIYESGQHYTQTTVYRIESI